jgi:hypothetical protein
VSLFQRYQLFLGRHEHRWIESYSGGWADEPGGPRTMHLTHWTCEGCGKRMGDRPDFRAFDPGETLAMREAPPLAQQDRKPCK